MTLLCDWSLWGQYRFGSTNKVGFKCTSHSRFRPCLSMCSCKWAVVSLTYPAGRLWGSGKVLVLPLLPMPGGQGSARRVPSLLPAASPSLSLHSGAVLWPPWGIPLLKHRRQRKRAQPAPSLPCDQHTWGDEVWWEREQVSQVRAVLGL